MAKKKPTDWPATLKSLREYYGLTQKQAAAKIDAPLSTWRNWEQGRNKLNPMLVMLIKLAFPEFFAR